MNHILFDMNISKDIVKILRTLGENRVKHLSEKYPHATDDLVFLPELAEQKALLVTCDISMVRTPAQRLMLLKANNTAIFLPDTFSQAKPWEQAHWLLVHWKRIIPQVQPGICYSVSARGKVKPIDLRRYRRKLKKAVEETALMGGIDEAVEVSSGKARKPSRGRKSIMSPDQLDLLHAGSMKSEDTPTATDTDIIRE